MAEHMTRDEYERRRAAPLIDKAQDQQFLPAGSLDFSTVRRITLRSRLRRWLSRRDEHSGEVERLRDEHDRMSEIIRHPEHLLNHLMDARGVEPLPGYEWGSEGLPAAIRIPADLSRKVFGGAALSPLPSERKGP